MAAIACENGEGANENIQNLIEVGEFRCLWCAISEVLKYGYGGPKGICLVKNELEQTYGLIGGEPSLDAAINYSNIGCLEIWIPDGAFVA